MSNLVSFDFNSFVVRATSIDGSPWIVAKDLCDVLGISKYRDALSRLDGDEKSVATFSTTGGDQKLAVVSESGMYALVLGSRKPEAKAFRKWVTGTVLPEIRRTGSYQGGSGQAEGCPDWFYRLRVFRRNTKIPVGWFCIFEEIAGLMADFEEAGYSLPMGSVPDISVGKCFANHLKANNIPTDGMIRYYLHIYPDGREVDARIYSYNLLPEFKQWFNATYRVGQLKGYLKRKDPQALTILQNILTAYEEAEQRFIA